jgi:hypothetical protein
MIDLTQDAALELEASTRIRKLNSLEYWPPYENAYMKRTKFQRARYLIQTRLHNARLPYETDSCERDG